MSSDCNHKIETVGGWKQSNRCSDLYKSHNRVITKCLISVGKDLADKNGLDKNVKVCTNCLKKMNRVVPLPVDLPDNISDQNTSQESNCLDTEIGSETRFLRRRFEKALTIQGTRSFHGFIPTSDYEMKCKNVSTSNSYALKPVVSPK